MGAIKSSIVKAYRAMFTPENEKRYDLDHTKFLSSLDHYALQGQIIKLFRHAKQQIYVCAASPHRFTDGLLLNPRIDRILARKDKEGVDVRALVTKDLSQKLDKCSSLDTAIWPNDIGNYIVVDSNSVVKFKRIVSDNPDLDLDRAILVRNTGWLGDLMAGEFISHYVVAETNHRS